jgi:hypothetical protein
MMSLLKGIFFLLLLSLQIISCNSREKAPQKPSSEKGVEIDSNVVLTAVDSKIITREQSMVMIVKLLGLNDIKNGSPDQEIRVWFGYALSDSGKIIVLKNTKQGWYSAAYYFKGNIDDRGNVLSVEKKVEEKSPLSGWDKLLKELNGMGIYKLKNYDKITNYFLCNDGDGLIIEIWKDKLYKIYDYPCFNVYEDKLDDVKRVKKICLLIQKEFGYRLFPSPNFR